MQRNLGPIFDIYARGVSDKSAIVFKKIGIAAYAFVPIGLVLNDRYHGTKLWGYAAAICFLLGPIMFICFAARVTGLQNGTSGFGRQVRSPIKKTILYLLLPVLLISIALTIIALQNQK